jgi:hypothetical protein
MFHLSLKPRVSPTVIEMLKSLGDCGICPVLRIRSVAELRLDSRIDLDQQSFQIYFGRDPLIIAHNFSVVCMFEIVVFEPAIVMNESDILTYLAFPRFQ